MQIIDDQVCCQQRRKHELQGAFDAANIGACNIAALHDIAPVRGDGADQYRRDAIGVMQ